VAAHTAAKLVEKNDEWLKGVILENTFTSIDKMADKLFPFLKMIPNVKKRMMRLDWNSEARVGKITKPILFIGGVRDQLCPVAMTKDLFRAATGSAQKELWLVPDGDHNDTYLKAGPEYPMRLRKFMAQCLGEQVAASSQDEGGLLEEDKILQGEDSGEINDEISRDGERIEESKEARSSKVSTEKKGDVAKKND